MVKLENRISKSENPVSCFALRTRSDQYPASSIQYPISDI